VGLDWRAQSDLFLGAEGMHRDVDVPQFEGDRVGFADRDEDIYRGYVYWAPLTRLALSAEYGYEDVGNEALGPERVRTKTFPLAARYFSPLGLFGELVATRVDQTVRDSEQNLDRDQDDFWVVDAAIGYRLPKRRGIVSLEVNNLFDQDFFYQDDNYLSSEPVAPRYIPDRTIVGKLSLSF
jgi:outer membrane receptor protein involved in Fe transport